MGTRRLLWHIYPSHLAIILLSLLGATLFLTRSVRRFHVDRLADGLRTQAFLAAREVAGPTGLRPDEEIAELCAGLDAQAGTRLTVILPSGAVLADSRNDPAAMDSHSDRPEVRAAMRGEVGESTRYSDTMREDFLYVGYPVERDGTTLAVVRASVSLRSVGATLRVLHARTAVAGLVVVALAALLSLAVSERIARPVRELTRATSRFAAGDLDFRLPPFRSEEMNLLASSMNSMAEQLRDRINTVLHQRNEREAVFASMVEGVLAIAADHRVLHANGAAGHLLGTDASALPGRRLEELVRNAALHDVLETALQSGEPVEREIVLEQQHEQRYLQARGAPLRDPAGAQIGALIVLNDVTRVRRLEDVRRDFVANVSHELRTPITSIKGFVETLQDGAVEDVAERDRFLGIIARHVDRLNSILSDLLSLSRIEHGAGEKEIELAETGIGAVLKEAAEICSRSAARKNSTVDVACSPGLSANVNAPLLEEAVVNIIDNALKYSDEGKTVKVEAVEHGNDVLIRVTDAGWGIEKKHLDRLFERFYRVDSGRSRALGGTGLGLAIVKHIVLMHDGSIDVESTPGEGSQFTIRLPRMRSS